MFSFQILHTLNLFQLEYWKCKSRVFYKDWKLSGGRKCMEVENVWYVLLFWNIYLSPNNYFSTTSYFSHSEWLKIYHFHCCMCLSIWSNTFKTAKTPYWKNTPFTLQSFLIFKKVEKNFNIRLYNKYWTEHFVILYWFNIWKINDKTYYIKCSFQLVRNPQI